VDELASVLSLYRRAGRNPAFPQIDLLAKGNLGDGCLVLGNFDTLGRDDAALTLTARGYKIRIRDGLPTDAVSLPIARELARWDLATHGPQDAPLDAVAAALLLPAPAVRLCVDAGMTAEDISWKFHAPLAIAALRVRLVCSPYQSGEFPSVKLAIA
jgi:hypothetical protein